MTVKTFSLRHSFLTAIILTATLNPMESLACACGCGIFDISTSSMLPTHEGGMVFVEYDFMNQDHNWQHSSGSPSANNDDKDIKTHFFTAGAQYLFNRSWGVQASVPYWQRHFTTTDQNTGDVVSFDHGSLGDVRLKGIYSGFSPDMSSGITFGTKLPTGNYTQTGFDRDTSIGAGSTDILLGAYHVGKLAGSWNWFANGELDQPVLIKNGYRPGSDINAVTGVYYQGVSIGDVRISPVAQITGSYRLRDRGLQANRANSGYERLLLSPGLEIDTGAIKLYGDVGFPVMQYVRGNQLTSNVFFKLNISRSF